MAGSFGKWSARLQLLLMAGAGCAFADYMHWTGPNSLNTNWGGYYTSPSRAVDTTTNVNMTLFCLDFNHEVAPPYDWQADIYELNPSNVQAHALYGAHADAFTRYLQAAWLFTNITDAFNHQPADTVSMIISQVAAWELFVDAAHAGTLNAKVSGTGGTYTFNNYIDGKSNAGLTFANAVDKALSEAQTAVAGGWGGANAGSWATVTGHDSSGKPVQEFLAPVPEPSAVVLLGTMAGVLGFACVFRRRPCGR